MAHAARPGGADTTAQAMANAILFLAENPDTLAEAIADPELWPRVFEETVRLRPSSTFASRRAEEDVVLSGVRIRKGDMIWVALTSANTDPTGSTGRSSSTFTGPTRSRTCRSPEGATPAWGRTWPACRAPRG